MASSPPHADRAIRLQRTRLLGSGPALREPAPARLAGCHCVLEGAFAGPPAALGIDAAAQSIHRFDDVRGLGASGADRLARLLRRTSSTTAVLVPILKLATGQSRLTLVR